MLEEMDNWLAEFPPLDNPQRFGNKAFRQWANKVEQVKTKERKRKCKRLS